MNWVIWCPAEESFELTDWQRVMLPRRHTPMITCLLTLLPLPPLPPRRQTGIRFVNQFNISVLRDTEGQPAYFIGVQIEVEGELTTTADDAPLCL
jgi:hypothetical protein